MFWDVKSDLTDALYTMVNAPSDENFCGFVFTYTKKFVIYGDIWMSTVCWTCIYTNKYASISFLCKIIGGKILQFSCIFLNYWVCIKYLTDWCLVGYDLEATLSLIFTRCFTSGVSASRDKVGINDNFIYLIT